MTAVIVNFLLVFVKHSRHNGPSVVVCFLAIASFPTFAERTAFIDFYRTANDNGADSPNNIDVGEAWLRVRGTYSQSGSVKNLRGQLHKVLYPAFDVHGVVADVKLCHVDRHDDSVTVLTRVAD